MAGALRGKRRGSAKNDNAWDGWPPGGQSGIFPKMSDPSPRRWPFFRVTIGRLTLVLVLLGVTYAFWHGHARARQSQAALSDPQLRQLDSLLVVASDQIERGSTLLKLGLRLGASREFARAINTLALSDFHEHPQVVRHIDGLQAAVAASYRELRMVVPPAYAGAHISMPFDEARDASYSVAEFASAFELVAAAFRSRFGQAIEVIVGDDAEHLALYGPGGALDLRSSIMNRQQIAYVLEQCQLHQIRVRDFSNDSILKLEVQAAILAGLYGRAGTGLHLHIDRFAKRSDQ